MKPNSFLAALAATGLAWASAVVPSVVAQASHHDEPFQVWEKTIRELQAALEASETTSRELVERYVERVEAYDVEGRMLNAVRHLNGRASQIAHRLDQDRKHDRRGGPLFGIPIMLKDNIDTADQPTTAGSLALERSMPQDDAFITWKLREAGAVILGKANLTEAAPPLDGVTTVGPSVRRFAYACIAGPGSAAVPRSYVHVMVPSIS